MKLIRFLIFFYTLPNLFFAISVDGQVNRKLNNDRIEEPVHYFLYNDNTDSIFFLINSKFGIPAQVIEADGTKYTSDLPFLINRNLSPVKYFQVEKYKDIASCNLIIIYTGLKDANQLSKNDDVLEYKYKLVKKISKVFTRKIDINEYYGLEQFIASSKLLKTDGVFNLVVLCEDNLRAPGRYDLLLDINSKRESSFFNKLNNLANSKFIYADISNLGGSYKLPLEISYVSAGKNYQKNDLYPDIENLVEQSVSIFTNYLSSFYLISTKTSYFRNSTERYFNFISLGGNSYLARSSISYDANNRFKNYAINDSLEYLKNAPVDLILKQAESLNPKLNILRESLYTKKSCVILNSRLQNIYENNGLLFSLTLVNSFFKIYNLCDSDKDLLITSLKYLSEKDIYNYIFNRNYSSADTQLKIIIKSGLFDDTFLNKIKEKLLYAQITDNHYSKSYDNLINLSEEWYKLSLINYSNEKMRTVWASVLKANITSNLNDTFVGIEWFKRLQFHLIKPKFTDEVIVKNWLLAARNINDLLERVAAINDIKLCDELMITDTADNSLKYQLSTGLRNDKYQNILYSKIANLGFESDIKYYTNIISCRAAKQIADCFSYLYKIDPNCARIVLKEVYSNIALVGWENRCDSIQILNKSSMPFPVDFLRSCNTNSENDFFIYKILKNNNHLFTYDCYKLLGDDKVLFLSIKEYGSSIETDTFSKLGLVPREQRINILNEIGVNISKDSTMFALGLLERAYYHRSCAVDLNVSFDQCIRNIFNESPVKCLKYAYLQILGYDNNGRYYLDLINNNKRKGVLQSPKGGFMISPTITKPLHQLSNIKIYTEVPFNSRLFGIDRPLNKYTATIFSIFDSEILPKTLK